MKLSRKLHHELEIFFREFFDDVNLRLPEVEIFCNSGAKFVTKIIGVSGITFGRFVFISPDLIYRNNLHRLSISKNLLAHEAAHVLQYRNLGTVNFLYRYFKSYLVNLRQMQSCNAVSRYHSYLAIPFEIEAREAGAAFAIRLEKEKAEIII